MANWETIIDFTEIDSKGIEISELLERLRHFDSPEGSALDSLVESD